MKVYKYRCSDGNGWYYNGELSAINIKQAESILIKKYHSIIKLTNYNDMTKLESWLLGKLKDIEPDVEQEDLYTGKINIGGIMAMELIDEWCNIKQAKNNNIYIKKAYLLFDDYLDVCLGLDKNDEFDCIRQDKAHIKWLLQSKKITLNEYRNKDSEIFIKYLTIKGITTYEND